MMFKKSINILVFGSLALMPLQLASAQDKVGERELKLEPNLTLKPLVGEKLDYARPVLRTDDVPEGSCATTDENYLHTLVDTGADWHQYWNANIANQGGWELYHNFATSFCGSNPRPPNAGFTSGWKLARAVQCTPAGGAAALNPSSPTNSYRIRYTGCAIPERTGTQKR